MRLKFSIVGILVILLVSASVGHADECPDLIRDWDQCPEYEEEYLLKNNPDKVKRKGDVLTISLRNGKSREFENDIVETDQFIRYSLLRIYDDPDYVLLRLQFWEGGSYELVSREDGTSEYLINLPVFSPNKTRVASARCCDDSGYSDSGLDVFKLTRSGLKAEKVDAAISDASDLKWLSETKIKFTKFKFGPENHDWINEGEKEIFYQDGKWVIK